MAEPPVKTSKPATTRRRGIARFATILWAQVMAHVDAMAATLGLQRDGARLRRDTRANVDFTAPLGVIFVVVGAILSFIVIGALIDPFLGATEDVTENFTNGTTGDDGADGLLAALGPVIPLIAVIVLFGMIITAFTLRRG